MIILSINEYRETREGGGGARMCRDDFHLFAFANDEERATV